MPCHTLCQLGSHVVLEITKIACLLGMKQLVILNIPNLTISGVTVCRLDAIGAIGIARCFSFGGKFGRPLYDPTVPPRDNLTKSNYMDSAYKPTTINHFYEKLLKLQVLFCAL